MNALEADHQGLGLLTLPDGQKNPRRCFCAIERANTTGEETPARARRAADAARQPPARPNRPTRRRGRRGASMPS
ncbi:hypothetical protein QJS66_23760 (plasmid) [Kocuria rhizophila]|nr:hypothetical protein QJS66_23760 [Kocuria rhizophila]